MTKPKNGKSSPRRLTLNDKEFSLTATRSYKETIKARTYEEAYAEFVKLTGIAPEKIDCHSILGLCRHCGKVVTGTFDYSGDRLHVRGGIVCMPCVNQALANLMNTTPDKIKWPGPDLSKWPG